MHLRFIVLLFATGTAMLGSGVASSQDYPSKPIRIITGAVGGSVDFVARQISQAGILGQQVVVDNRPAGFLAAELGAKAPPDGYTLNVQGSSLWIGPQVRPAPYDPLRDFTPISLLVREVYVIGVNPSLPVKSVKELIALAKTKPGELNYASGSLGGSGHLAGELFAYLAGVKFTYVPYKGTAPAVTSVVTGESHVLVNDAGTLAPFLKAGKIRALAIATSDPSALLPDLPTVTAAGVSGYEWPSVSVLQGPAKLPAVIVNRLHQEVCRTFNTNEMKRRFLDLNQEVVCSTPEALGNLIKADTGRVAKLIKDVGLKFE